MKLQVGAGVRHSLLGEGNVIDDGRWTPGWVGVRFPGLARTELLVLSQLELLHASSDLARNGQPAASTPPQKRYYRRKRNRLPALRLRASYAEKRVAKPDGAMREVHQ